MCERLTSSQTSVDDPSEQETALMDLVTGELLPAYLEEAGYNVTPTETLWEDSPEYKDFQKKKERARLNITNAQREGDQEGINRENNNLAQLEATEATAASEYVPATSYEVEKKDPPHLEAIKEKYGKESSQYTEAKSQFLDDTITREKEANEVNKLFVSKVKKFLEGDFSITDEQKALIEENMKPTRAAVEKLFKEELSETMKAFDDFEKQISDTDMDIGAALDVVGTQIIQTGKDMDVALTDTITANRALLENGIRDFTGEVTKQVNASAASLGRDPGDPEYTKDISDLVARKVADGSLRLAAMEAQGKVGIAERTGAGLEGVAGQRAGLAERTGGLRERAAMGRGEARADVARRKGSAEVGIEEQAANLRWQVGASMPPQQAQAGMGLNQFLDAKTKFRMDTSAAAMGAPVGVSSFFQRERLAQPTTTQTSGGGFMDVLSGGLGLVSAGANIYSGVTTANAWRDMAGGPRGRFSGGSGFF